MSVSPDVCDGLLAAVVRGDESAWPSTFGQPDEAQFVERAHYHGVAPLVFAKLGARNAIGSWPRAIREAMGVAARNAAARAMLREIEVKRFLAALASAGLRPLLMKGVPLAYSHYETPHLRAVVDVDVLVDPPDYEPATRVLEEMGYERLGEDSSPTQRELVYTDAHGARHVVDLHLHFSGGDLFDDLPDFATLDARAVPVPALGSHARALYAPHALLLACAHRLHHTRSDRLIWLYDIALLAATMSEAEIEEFASLAADRRLSDVCARGLDAAQREIGGVPEPALARVAAGGRRTPELSRLLVPDDLRVGHRVARELIRSPGWIARARLVVAYLFPPVSYMRARYRPLHPALLPLSYLGRLVRGVAVPFRRLRS